MSGSRNVTEARNAALALAVLDPDNLAAKQASQWISNRQRDTLLRKQELTEELSKAAAQVYTSSMAKCYEQLADLAFETGDFREAQSYVLQQRDILMDSDDKRILHKLAMIMFYAGNETSARAYTEKLAPKLVEKSGLFFETSMATQVGAILGILYFKYGHIRQAVGLFLNLSPAQLKEIPDITTSEDVATYITLGAMTTFSRAELNYLSKSDSAFLMLTEDSRQNFSNLIELMLNSKFVELFKQLDRYRTDYLLDPVLYESLEELLYRIRVRCFVQYLSVFSTVLLTDMAAAFGLDVTELEQEVTQLIESRSVNALIDQKRGILVCRSQDDVSKLFHNAEAAAQHYLAESKTLLATLI